MAEGDPVEKPTPPQAFREEVTDADRSMLAAMTGFAGLPPLTAQQQRFVLMHMKGLSPNAAAKAAGYVGQSAGATLLRHPSVQQALAAFHEKIVTEIKVDRNRITQEMYEAHSHAGTATEEIMALREIAKLHGLYAPVEKKMSVDIEAKVTSVKHIERLSDQELGTLIGEEIVLDPEDYSTVDDD